jgi:hypothetical protein
MMELWVWACLLALLVWQCLGVYAPVRADESPVVQREQAFHAAIERGCSDDHLCDLCHKVVSVREVVLLYDDAALACPGCADLLKLNRRLAA